MTVYIILQTSLKRAPIGAHIIVIVADYFVNHAANPNISQSINSSSSSRLTTTPTTTTTTTTTTTATTNLN